MPYFTIKDFAAGMDLRRASLTAPAGTLRELTNCHVTPGGEIEKRYAFLKFATLPSTTRGIIELTCLRTGAAAGSEDFVYGLYTFQVGGGAAKVDPSTTWDVGTLQLATPSMYEVIDYDTYAGKVFVSIWPDNAGSPPKRFYDQVEVADTNCKGYYVRAYKTKIHTVQGRHLYYSCVNNPAVWTNDDPATTGVTEGGAGSGQQDLSIEDSDMYDCVGLEVYYDKMAIFSKKATQLWILDPDPSKNQYSGTLRGAGAIAWRSILQYGSGDVLYLAPDGIRSLRARNSSLAAAVSDVGSPIDPILQELYRTKGEDWMSQAISILQPVTGRIWVIMQDRIFVLSAFPGPGITAWSEYIPTDSVTNLAFRIVAACSFKNRIVVRDDQHNVYVYGNTADTGGIYDACEARITFPFLGGDDPATEKVFTGLDAAVTGQWDVYAAYNPENEAAEDYLGKLTGPTFEQGRFPVEGVSTHMSLRLRSTFAGPLLLSNMIMHYKQGASG